MEFDLLIGQPIERLLVEGQTWNLNVYLGKGFKLPLSITHSIQSKTEPSPEPDPMEEVKEASVESNQEDVTEFSSRKNKKIPLNPNTSMNSRNLLDLTLSLNFYHLV